MIAELVAWANLALRWLHLVAGIAWIGSSFYFMWLDSHLKAPAVPRGEGVAGELWSVHSGGFYHQMKFMVAPADMPEELHWFKWEAYTTWISGFLLLSLIFYVGADLNLVDKAKADLEAWQAIAIGLGSLVAGWLIYDGLCRSPLGQNLKLFGGIWFGLMTAAGYGLTRILADLGAFMHVGAIIGTVMVANVFLIIIPNQRKVVAQVLAGQAPDPALGKQAKQRQRPQQLHDPAGAVHHDQQPLPDDLRRAAELAVAGGAGGHRLDHPPLLQPEERRPQRAAGAGHGRAGLRDGGGAERRRPAEAAAGRGGPRPMPLARAIVDRHCVMCHAAHPTHKDMPVAPNGAMFDTAEGLQKYADRIYERAVATPSMPMGNETGMTDAERAALGAWIKAGAKWDHETSPESSSHGRPQGDPGDPSGLRRRCEVVWVPRSRPWRAVG